MQQGTRIGAGTLRLRQIETVGEVCVAVGQAILNGHIAARGHDVSVGLRGFVEGHLGGAIGTQLPLPLRLAGHG